jgi:hypothetical protein
MLTGRIRRTFAQELIHRMRDDWIDGAGGVVVQVDLRTWHSEKT